MISQSVGRGARVHTPLCQTLSVGASSCHVAQICSGSPGFTQGRGGKGVFLPQSGKMSQVSAPRGGLCLLWGLHRSEIINSTQPNSANSSGWMPVATRGCPGQKGGVSAPGCQESTPAWRLSTGFLSGKDFGNNTVPKPQIKKKKKKKPIREIHCIPGRMTHIQLMDSTKHWRGRGATETLIRGWGACKMVPPLCKTVWRFLTKLHTLFPHDPAIVLLGIYPKELKTYTHTNTTQTFTAAFFRTAKT